MKTEKAIAIGIWILVTLAFGSLVHEASTIFIWTSTSFFLFALLDPTSQKLKSRGHSTMVSSLTLVVLATAISGFLLYLLGHFSAGVVKELQDSRAIFLNYYQRLDQAWTSLSESVASAVKATAPPGSAIPSAAPKVQVVESSQFGAEFRASLLGGLGSAVTVFTFAVLIPILTFFLLAERDLLANAFRKIGGNSFDGSAVWERIVSATRAFFLGNLVLGLVTYPIFALVFILFSVPSAFTLAGLASFFNLIPFLGAVLSGFLPALTVLGEGGRVAAAIGVYGICLAVHFAVANFVTPKVLGSKVDLNATASTIALIAWGELLGGFGLILAIPITATIKICLEHSGVSTLRLVASLMSEKVDDELKTSVEKKIEAAN